MLGTHSIVRWGCFFLMLSLCGCQTTQKQARQSGFREVREPGHSDTARASKIAYAHRPSGVRFPLVFAGLGQSFFHNFEQKSKGSGVAVGYNGALVTLTLYIYNSRHRRIPNGHKNVLLKEAYKSALKGIAVYSRRLGFQSFKYHWTRLAPLLNSQPTPKAVYSMFSYKYKGRKTWTVLAMVTHHHHFLKLRMTYDHSIHHRVGRIFLAKVFRDMGRLIKNSTKPSR